MIFYSVHLHETFVPEMCILLSPGLNPFPNDKILDSTKLKEFADNNFKLDENGRKFAKWVENTEGKGEIACYNFSFSHSFSEDL